MIYVENPHFMDHDKPWIWCFTTYSPSQYLDKAIASLPGDEGYKVYDVKELDMSLPAVWNKAIKENLDLYETVIICNDDIEIVRPDTGKVMHTALHQLAHKVDGVMVNAYNTKLFGDRGLVFISGLLQALQDKYEEGPPNWLPEFSCFAVGRELINTVGWFDENFDPCFYEDIDMVRRIALTGKNLYVTCPVFHHCEGSWEDHKDRRVSSMEKSRQYYIKKWGGDMMNEEYNIPFNAMQAKVIVPV